MPGARRRGRPRTAWIDNIKSWTGFSVEESIRMTGDRDKWRKYVHGVATLGSRTAKEQNKTETAMNLSVLSCLCLSLWLVGWSLTSLFSTNTAISKTCCYNHWEKMYSCWVMSRLITNCNLVFFYSMFAVCIADFVGHSVCDIASSASDGLENLCTTICLWMCCVLGHIGMLCVDILVCYQAEQLLDKVGPCALHR